MKNRELHNCEKIIKGRYNLDGGNRGVRLHTHHKSSKNFRSSPNFTNRVVSS